jgi:hypothetical protein
MTWSVDCQSTGALIRWPLGDVVPGTLSTSNRFRRCLRRAPNQRLEIVKAHHRSHRGDEGFERADLVGQVCGYHRDGVSIPRPKSHDLALTQAAI